MGFSKLSVTIPNEIYRDIKKYSLEKNLKVSHLVTDALADKILKIKENSLLNQINKVYADPEAAEANRLMAESIADNTDVEELPW